MTAHIEVFESSGQKDASTLAGGLGLRNEGSAALGLVLELFAEVTELCRQEPCLRIKFVFLGEPFEHLVQVSSEVVFSGQRKHAREMINSLVRLHFVKTINCDAVVAPIEIPLVFLIGVVPVVVAQTHLKEFFADVFHDMVLRLSYIHDQLFLSVFWPPFFLFFRFQLRSIFRVA